MFRFSSFQLLKVASQISNRQRLVTDTWRHNQRSIVAWGTLIEKWSSRRLGSSTATPYYSVEEALLARVKDGDLRNDLSQLRAAKRLSRLQGALNGYDNEPLLSRQIKAGITTKEKETVPPKETEPTEEKSPTPSIKMPRGLYIYGEVGTGKTMLMDLFFHHTLTELESRRRRCHFHSFMADIHHRIHHIKQQDLKEKGRNFSIDTSRQNNPIIRVAHQLASECLVLCLDEFQVTDIADAMILSQLFEELWLCGTVLVATSNRAPQGLYEGGLNRDYFVPFIHMLERHCIIHEMKSTMDYRKLNVATAHHLGTVQHYFITSGGNHATTNVTAFAEELFQELMNGREPRPTTLNVGLFGRNILVQHADPEGLVARFNFSDLCERNIGAMDFRAIAEQFSILLIENVPKLSLENPSQHDRARRFITLIDEAYEAKCALFCSTMDSSVVSPDDLLVVNDIVHHGWSESATDSSVASPDNLLVVNGVDFNLLSDSKSASVRELAFAFRRAASRITEMCSQAWWEKQVLTETSQQHRS